MTTHVVDLVLDGMKFHITCEYEPGYPGRGPSLTDPGEPPEPDEFWLEKVEVERGGVRIDVTDILSAVGVDLSDTEEPLVNQAYEAVISRLEEPEGDEPDDDDDDVPW